MSTKEITADDVIETLKQVVADKGEDYVYPLAGSGNGCVYAVNGEPSCIVGHVVYRLAPDLFKWMDETETETGISEGFENLAGIWYRREAMIAVPSDFDSPWGRYIDSCPAVPDALIEASGILAVAQEYQDNGNTWGRVLYHSTLSDEPEDYE